MADSFIHPGGWGRRAGRLRQAWWVLVGKFSLHRAWQKGYDDHIVAESKRRAALPPESGEKETGNG